MPTATRTGVGADQWPVDVASCAVLPACRPYVAFMLSTTCRLGEETLTPSTWEASMCHKSPTCAARSNEKPLVAVLYVEASEDAVPSWISVSTSHCDEAVVTTPSSEPPTATSSLTYWL